MNLGNHPNRALLTGAGFTANWRGFLASDVWRHVFGHSKVASRLAIQRVLREALGDFELALHLARHDPNVSADDRHALEAAVVDAFREQERTIAHPSARQGLNEHGVQELLSFFGAGRLGLGNLFDGVDSGYIFTLNQDWLVERLSAKNGHIFATPTRPGVPLRTQRFAETQREFDIDDVRFIALAGQERPKLHGNLNYIKLHGSFEWRTSDGRAVLVVGGEKSTQIGEFDLLRFYFEVFEQVLATEGLRLMVIGYGFGDTHVNAALARAVRASRLSIFVIDTRREIDIREALLRRGDDGKTIFNAIVGFSRSPLTAIFAPPLSDDRTVEYSRILREFFGASHV
jgi:hypothetical protein